MPWRWPGSPHSSHVSSGGAAPDTIMVGAPPFGWLNWYSLSGGFLGGFIAGSLFVPVHNQSSMSPSQVQPSISAAPSDLGFLMANTSFRKETVVKNLDNSVWYSSGKWSMMMRTSLVSPQYSYLGLLLGLHIFEDIQLFVCPILSGPVWWIFPSPIKWFFWVSSIMQRLAYDKARLL
jgi:hypothetical protein